MDFASFSDEELEGFICSMGIEGVAGANRAELESLLASMLTAQNSGSTTTTVKPSSPSNLDTAMILEDSDSEENARDSSAVDLTEEDVLQPVNASNPEEEMKLANFVGITGSDPEAARGYLEAMGWDLNSAVSLYLESNSGPALIQHSSASTINEAPQSSSFQQATNPLSAAFERVRAENFIGRDADFMQETLREMQRHLRENDEDLVGEDEDYQYPVSDEYDEEGVRKPDRVRIQQLLPTQHFPRFTSSHVGRIDDPSVEWLFPAPAELSFPEDFDKAKEEASSKGRWLLVNLQSHDEFSSHRLNRDTWSNDTLQSLLAINYLFWQRGHTSADGQEYMRLYHVAADQLPHIAIINPITGAKIKAWQGFISPEDLSIALVEFADDHSLTGGGLLKRKFPGNSNSDRAESTASASSSTPLPPPPVPEQQVTDMPPAPPAETTTSDFGPSPPLPADDEIDTIKISIKLASGKAIARKYRKTDLVKGLFAVVLENDASSASRAFELISRYPAANLSSCLEKTLDECQLANGLVLHRYV